MIRLEPGLARRPRRPGPAGPGRCHGLTVAARAGAIPAGPGPHWHRGCGQRARAPASSRLNAGRPSTRYNLPGNSRIQRRTLRNVLLRSGPTRTPGLAAPGLCPRPARSGGLGLPPAREGRGRRSRISPGPLHGRQAAAAAAGVTSHGNKGICSFFCSPPRLCSAYPGIPGVAQWRP